MNKGRWTPAQKDYVLDSIGKIPLQEICEKLNKSELAVNLFLHRNKIYRGAVVKKNIVLEILRIKFVHPEYFAPTKAFYAEVKINQIRWWNLYFGRKQITQEEYLSLAKHFNVSLEEAFEARQLTLFEEGETND